MSLISERIDLLLTGTVLTILVNFLAWQWGFYGKSSKSLPLLPSISLPSLFLMLLAFFALQTIVIPVISALLLALFSGEIPNLHMPSEKRQIWMNIIVMFSTPWLLWRLLYFLEPEAAKAFVKEPWREKVNNFALGASAWLIVFPAAQVVGVLMEMFVSSFLNAPEVDQDAVTVLKNAFANPWQYWLTIIGISTAVPFVEELVTRGCLQGWLRTKYGAATSIVVASLIFAFLHFSFSYGWRNLELLPALFMLSCYLGYLYERQHSLWASIGLHATFNIISICMITFQTISEKGIPA